MSSFLTLEDVNSVNLDNISEYYTLDTSKISEQEFNSVLYDFCLVSHSVSSGNHTFTFQIYNTLWTGDYWFTDGEGVYLDIDASYNDNIISFTSTNSVVKLHLYLCSFVSNFLFNKASKQLITDGVRFINRGENGTSEEIKLLDLTDGSEITSTITRQEGIVDVSSDDDTVHLLYLIKKTDLVFNLNDVCIVGIVNHVRLNVDSEYLPGGSLIGDEAIDMEVYYNDDVIEVSYDADLNDYCFDLDLTDKINDNNINLVINLNESDYVNANNYDVKVLCSYSFATTFDELQSNIVAGAKVIELTNDITFDNSITLPNELYLIGGDNTVNFGGNNIIIPDGISFKLSDTHVVNGQSCFVQYDNSKAIFEKCIFTNASITDNFKGSVVTANYKNTTTEITNCKFLNCHHSIYHGGTLTIDNCQALFNIWNDSIDTDYSAFLTAYDGNVGITNSVFDIDYANYEDIIIANQVNVKYDLSLVAIGSDTVFNGITGELLNGNDTLPFTSYNNQSHVYVAYYYPAIEEAVVASPTLGNEDKAICHNIIGVDWVYKNNVQITKLSDNTQNEDRSIIWRE